MRRTERCVKGWLSESTTTVARKLIGCRLVHDSPDGRTVGRIVETEAYLSSEDPASHSASGPTPRNASMFLPAGHAYVYFIYGMHHCFNVVTGPEGVGEAVLIRALEPLEGLDLMRDRRGLDQSTQLASGPGKLSQAMAIEMQQDGVRLLAGALRILSPEEGWAMSELVAGPRVGIRNAANLPYRYYRAGCVWRSR